jgi:hypothetical protein
MARILLLNILPVPTECNVTTFRTITDLRMSLGFTEEEVAKYGIVVDNEHGTVKWESGEEVEVNIGPIATDMIVAKLKELNEAEKLTPDQIMVLWDLFVPEDEKTEDATEEKDDGSA